MVTRRVSEGFTLSLADASGYQEHLDSKTDLPWNVYGGVRLLSCH